MTRAEAEELLCKWGWGATRLMGGPWMVGPVVDQLLECRGQGMTLEDAVDRALMAGHFSEKREDSND